MHLFAIFGILRIFSYFRAFYASFRINYVLIILVTKLIFDSHDLDNLDVLRLKSTIQKLRLDIWEPQF